MTSSREARPAPALLIEHARKDYGKAAVGRPQAVEDVSLSVTTGAIHGLLGPNGAGKTTTLKMLLGLVKPTAGTFEILGVPARKPGARSTLGFLPEQPYFPPQLTAEEALRLYGRLSGLAPSIIAEDGKRLLERVGLEGRSTQPLSRFSRGMLQRLGLAQALLGDPRVVVLDEPASGLDPVGQRDVRNLMAELKQQGTTILLSSHQLSEVEAVCDEVTILNAGRVAARGHIDELLSVKGTMVLRVRGAALPESMIDMPRTQDESGDWLLEIDEVATRETIDAVHDAGMTIVSLVPKRSSLEDYFAGLVDVSRAGSEDSDE